MYNSYMVIPYSGEFSWEKFFENCLELRFCGEKFREWLQAQLTTPTILNFMQKIFARGHQFVKFSPTKISRCTVLCHNASRHCEYDACTCTYVHVRSMATEILKGPRCS